MSTTYLWKWLRGCGFVLVVLAAACSSSPKGSGGSAGGGAGAFGGSDGGAGTSGVTSQTVGTQGGTVTLDGVTLTIPGNALSGDTIVTVSTATAPAGYIIASAAYQLAPTDATFAHAVSVTLPLTMTAPRAHLFLSNGSGGFEDRGGIVSGPIITGQITHFGTCFAATPSNDGGAPDVADAKDGSGGSAGNGAAGAAGTAGSGAAGAGAAGAGTAGSGTAGSGSAGVGAAGAGTAGSGTGGSGTAGAGTAGSGGQTDAGQSSDSADTGGASDADASGGTDVASSQLCAATGINAPVVTVTTITDGTPVPAGSTYTGGTISSGKYYLTAVTHYGGQYAGPQKSVRTFDTTAKTLRTIDSPFLQGTVLYDAFTISNADDHTLTGDLICSSTQAATTSWYYTVSGTTITMSQLGSIDVAVYTAGL